MKEIAEIQYTVDADRLKRLYYARYKVNYEKFSQEIYESRSENERKYKDVFFDDRVISENILKNENRHLERQLPVRAPAAGAGRLHGPVPGRHPQSLH